MLTSELPEDCRQLMPKHIGALTKSMQQVGVKFCVFIRFCSTSWRTLLVMILVHAFPSSDAYVWSALCVCVCVCVCGYSVSLKERDWTSSLPLAVRLCSRNAVMNAYRQDKSTMRFPLKIDLMEHSCSPEMRLGIFFTNLCSDVMEPSFRSWACKCDRITPTGTNRKYEI